MKQPLLSLAFSPAGGDSPSFHLVTSHLALNVRFFLQAGQSEIEARWRLVETAWELRISQNLLQVSTYQSGDEYFFRVQDGRTNITSARDALNGYQKGHCFYCFSDIALDSSTETFMDVDHFLPWMLRRSEGQFTPEVLNGVWNLVLAPKRSQVTRSSR